MGTREDLLTNLKPKHLQTLLKDPTEESQHFEQYLEQTGQLSYLEFIWAYNGLRTVEVDTGSRKKLISCIYQEYILNSRLSPALSSTTLLNIIKKLLEIEETLEIGDVYIKTHFIILDEIFSQVQQYLENIADLRYSHRSSKQIKSVSVPIILNKVNDGLPPPPPNLCQQMHFPHNKNQNTEEFAKELCQKLEALEVRGQNDVGLSSKNGVCEECTKEKEAEFWSKLETAFHPKITELALNPKSEKNSCFPNEGICTGIKNTDTDSRSDCYRLLSN